MTQEQIVEGNKLIAEFMGGRKLRDNDYYTFTEHPSYQFTGMDHRFETDMKYHASWDWLMPVIRKIFDSTSTTKGVGRYQSTIGALRIDIIRLLPALDIEVIWQACVDFIKYYNSVK